MREGDRIVLLCTGDRRGGAAMATMRLMQSLREQGYVVTMIVMNKESDDSDVVVAGSHWSRRRAFLSERFEIARHNGFKRQDLFAVSTASAGQPLERHAAIMAADVVIVSWTQQGLLSLDTLERIASIEGKETIIWMHDLWAMTGICHYPHECRRFTHECGCCPFLHSSCPRPDDLSHRVWTRKRELYERCPDIKFVAVSHWVAQMARLSSLLRDKHIRVIHNRLPIERYSVRLSGESILPEHIRGRHIVVMGAARLDEPIKGLDIAVEALNDMCVAHAEREIDTAVVMYGDIRDASIVEQLHMPVWLAGRLDESQVARLLSEADVILSTARYETYGLTLLEGIASGAWAVTLGTGGQVDIVVDGYNGYVIDGYGHCALSDLARRIGEAVNRSIEESPHDRDRQRESVMHLVNERFTP